MTAKWNSIDVFTIESAMGHTNVYANGRQSIKIRVAIHVVDINNNPVELTEEERLSITLVNYNGGQALLYADHGIGDPLVEKNGHKWDWSVQNIGGYNHFPSPRSGQLSVPDEMPGVSDGETAYIDFYVRTVDVLPLTLSVRITRSDGTLFFSREMDRGALTLTPVKPPSYQPLNYQLEKFVIVPFRRITDGRGGVGHLYYYRFGLKASNLEFRDVTCSPDGLHGDIGPGWTNEAAHMVGYVEPGRDRINYLFALTYVDRMLQWPPRSGQILFTSTYVQAPDGRHFTELRGRTAVLKTSLQAIDEYGNLHRLILRFKDNARSGDLELI